MGQLHRVASKLVFHPSKKQTLESVWYVDALEFVPSAARASKKQTLESVWYPVATGAKRKP